MDLIDIGPEHRHASLPALHIQFILLQIVKFGKVDPETIKRDVRIDNRAITSRHKDFFATIRVQQYEISTGLHADRIEDFWPARIGVIAVSRCTDIHNVIVDTL
jgi:hypothetical protein